MATWKHSWWSRSLVELYGGNPSLPGIQGRKTVFTASPVYPRVLGCNDPALTKQGALYSVVATAGMSKRECWGLC
jgi:hypothetical protein